MKKQEFEYKTILNNGLVAIIIISIMIFGSWYIMLNHAVGVAHQIKTTTYVVEREETDSITASDTITMYLNQLDSIKNDIIQLQRDYHDNIDLMINKANGWMAFWIGIVAVILGMLSILQIFRQIRATEKFKDLKAEISLSEKELGQKIDSAIDELKNQYAYLEKEKQNLLCTIHENRIAASMICISIPDPLIASSPSARRQSFCSQLKHIANDFEHYLMIILDRKDTDRWENVASILMNLKIALVRARTAFSGHDENVCFFNLINKINKAITDFQKLSIFIKEEDIDLLKDISKDYMDIVSRIG